MRKVRLLIVSLFVFSWLNAQHVYVSPTGDDGNLGTEASPFKSLQTALEHVAGAASGKTIWLKGGTYRIENTITLDKNHSGSDGNPLVIRSVVGETVVLAGGTPIAGSLFETVTTAAELARIPQVAQGKVMVAQIDESLASYFLTKDLYNQTASIAWNGYIMQNARFPNKGYAYFSETIEEGPFTSTKGAGYEPPSYSESNPTGGIFKMRESIDWHMLSAEFATGKDILLDGYLSNDWFFQQERIGNVDASKKEIQLLRYTTYGIGGTMTLPRRFVIKNALCQLDQPGEWYYDRQEKKFYIWPIQPPNSQQAISILGSARLIDGAGCSNLTLRDIDFQNFGIEGIRLADGENILIAGCDFRASNGMGCRLQTVMNSGVQSCDFSYLCQAFTVSGNVENRKTLTRENNFGRNNHIHHCTQRGYSLVSVSGMGSEFSNNLMHHQNGAYGYSGNDMTVQYNEFYDVGYEMGDWNVVYNNADFSELGNRIRRNFFHHMMETPGGYPIAPARTDDLGAGFHFEENILYKTGRVGAMFMGPDNSITGNVSMETPLLWWTLQAPYDQVDKSKWDTQTKYLQERYDEYIQLQNDIDAGHVSFNIKENKIGKGELIFDEKGWETNELWKAHYPNFSKMFNFFNIDENPWMPCHNDITKNYMSGGNSFPYHFHGGNSITDITTARELMPSTASIDLPITFTPSEMFEDADAFDFRFKDTFTPVAGFEKWDFDSVGLYVDEYRTSMPDKAAYRMIVKQKYAGMQSNGGSLNLDLLNDRYDFPEYFDLVSEFAVMPVRPVLYWSLDEENGIVSHDLISDANGTWQFATDTDIPSVVGLIGKAVKSNGNYQNHFRASSDTLSSATSATISAWVKLASLESGNVVVNGLSQYSQWGLRLADGKPVAVCNGDEFESAEALTLDEWHLLSMTWEMAGDAMLYVDGVKVTEKSYATSDTIKTSRWDYVNVASTVDDISIFDVVLTSDEIAFVYMNGMRQKSMRDILPVSVVGIKISPREFNMRVGFTASFATLISPSDATLQQVSWSSSNESIIYVDEKGAVLGVAEGTAVLTATTIDGGFSAQATIDVFEDMTGVFPVPDAYWPFDEMAGNVAFDVIGNVKANWEGLEDQRWNDGFFNRAGSFFGGTEDRFVTESDPLLGTDAFTVSAWVNLDKLGQYEGLLTTRTPSMSNNWGFAAADGRLDVRMDGQPGYIDGVMSTGSWFNIAITWNNNGDKATYVNGVQLASSTDGPTAYVSNERWFFGDDICCNSREIEGRIDEVLMYRQELTSAQIAEIYEMGKQGISYQDLFSRLPEVLTIEQDTIEVKQGNTDTVRYIVLPENAVNKVVLWETKDDAVATIDRYGAIHTVGLGQTTIVGTTQDGGIVDSCILNIITNPVTEIIISKDTVVEMENRLGELSAYALPITSPDKNLVWSTTDESVVTVNQFGSLRTYEEGIAYIIVTNEVSGVSDSCLVEVTAIHVTSVIFEQHELDEKGNSRFFIDYEILPSNAKNQNIVWTSSDTTVVRIIDEMGYFSTCNAGTSTIIGRAEDGVVYDSCIVRVDGGAGVDDVLAKHGILLYPNPAQKVVNFDFDNVEGVRNITFYNAMGQKVKCLRVESDIETIEVDDLSAGYYFVNVEILGEAISASLIITE